MFCRQWGERPLIEARSLLASKIKMCGVKRGRTQEVIRKRCGQTFSTFFLDSVAIKSRRNNLFFSWMQQLYKCQTNRKFQYICGSRAARAALEIARHLSSKASIISRGQSFSGSRAPSEKMTWPFVSITSKSRSQGAAILLVTARNRHRWPKTRRL